MIGIFIIPVNKAGVNYEENSLLPKKGTKKAAEDQNRLINQTVTYPGIIRILSAGN